MKNKIIYRTYIHTFFIALCLLLIGLFAPKDQLLITTETVKNLNQQWRFTQADNQSISVNLPASLSISGSSKGSLSKILPSDFNTPQTLRIRSSQQTLQVYIDQNLIYESFPTSTYWKHSPYGSMWHFISLPPHSNGKKLSIQVSSPLKKFSRKFNAVVYGSEHNLQMDLIRSHWKDLSIDLLLFAFGLFLFIVPFFLRAYNRWELAYLGLFTSTIALWFFTESKMMQFLTGNHWYISGLAYILLTLAPMPLVLYIRDAVMPNRKGFLTFLAHTFLINTIIVILLQYTGIMLFFESLFLTHFLIAFTTLSILFCFAKDMGSGQNPASLKFVKYMSILFIFAGIEMLHFYLNDFTQTSIYAKLGLLIFIVTQSLNYFKQLFAYIKKSQEAELYQRLAFEDQLTGGPNRMAFELDAEQLILDSSSNTNLRLMIFDLNNLKEINDTYGHILGDEAIKKAFDSIRGH